MACETVTAKIFLIQFIGVNILAEVVRLRISGSMNSNLHFLMGTAMIVFYFAFLVSLLTKSLRGMRLIYKGLMIILTIVTGSYMYCAVAIANEKFEHNVRYYLHYVLVCSLMGVSIIVQLLVLETYKRQVEEETEMEDGKELDV